MSWRRCIELDIKDRIMNRIQANKEAKKIFEEWKKEKNEVEKQAKAEGKWVSVGLDGNSHLFKDLNNKTKEKLRILNSMIDEK